MCHVSHQIRRCVYVVSPYHVIGSLHETENHMWSWGGCHIWHPYNLPTIKPPKCSNFSNLLWNRTLYVSDSPSVHHQEFFTVHTAMLYVIQVCWQLASKIRTDPSVAVFSGTQKFRWGLLWCSSRKFDMNVGIGNAFSTKALYMKSDSSGVSWKCYSCPADGQKIII